jgi:hypothetical protein
VTEAANIINEIIDDKGDIDKTCLIQMKFFFNLSSDLFAINTATADVLFLAVTLCISTAVN